MPRKRAAKEQVSIALVVDKTALALRRAMKKVRELNVLTEVLVHPESSLSDDEVAALELAVRAYLATVEGKQPEGSEHQQLVACWRREYEAATGQAAPRLTDRESDRLDDIINPSRGLTGPNRLERACALIKAFWPYRESLEKNGATPPRADPFGLMKNLAPVTAFYGERNKKTDGKRKAREIEQAQEAALASPPDPEQVHRFVESFKTGKANRFAASGADDARPSSEPGAGASAVPAGSSS
jgi:hypothetical protein